MFIRGYGLYYQVAGSQSLVAVRKIRCRNFVIVHEKAHKLGYTVRLLVDDCQARQELQSFDDNTYVQRGKSDPFRLPQFIYLKVYFFVVF